MTVHKIGHHFYTFSCSQHYTADFFCIIIYIYIIAPVSSYIIMNTLYVILSLPNIVTIRFHGKETLS